MLNYNAKKSVGRVQIFDQIKQIPILITDEGNIGTTLSNSDGVSIDVQHPLPVDGDQVYAKDINLAYSYLSDGWSGDISDLFTGFRSQIINNTVNNPKTIYIEFERAILTNIFGAGNRGSGDFSNIKIIGEVIDGTELLLLDESADNTKKNRFVVRDIPLISFVALKIEFHTSDTITFSTLAIAKTIQTTSRIQGRDFNGVARDAGVTQDGYLAISDNSSGLAISEGIVIGKSPIHKFGKAPDFDVVDGYVTIWDGANDAGLNQMQYVYTTTSPINTISSSDAGDTQEVEIQGLDFTTKELVIQTKSLDGQNKVTLDTSLYRVFRVRNQGSTKFAGTFYCYEDTAIVTGVPTDITKVKAVIAIGINVKGHNQTQMAIYTVPAGKTAYVNDIYVSPAGAKKTSVHNWQLHSREDGGVWQIKLDKTINTAASGDSEKQYSTPEIFEALTDIELSVNTDEDTAGISGGFDIILVDS